MTSTNSESDDKSKHVTSNESDSDSEPKAKTVSNKEFIEKVKEYLKTDELIKQKAELVKQKKVLEDFLLKYLENKKINTLVVGNTTVKRTAKDKKEPLDKKNIKKTLLDGMKKEGLIKSDGTVKADSEKVIESVLEIMEKRPISKVYKLSVENK